MDTDSGSNHLCTTVYDKGDTVDERKKKAQQRVRCDAKVWLKREGMRRIRVSSQRMCLKIVRDNETMDQHFVRTIARTLNREECMGGEGRAVKSVGERFIGKFRSKLLLNKSNFEAVYERKRIEENGGIQYVDVVIGCSGRQRCMLRTRGTDGNGSGIVKKRRTRRKRRIAPLSEFRLFEHGKRTGAAGSSESPGEDGMDSESGGESERREEEEESNEGQEGETVGARNSEWEKFSKSIQECDRCIDLLFNGWADVRFLRCSGGRRRNQKYVCVSTVRICRRKSNGDEVETVLVNIVVEEQSRKVRSMCIRREEWRYNGNGNGRTEMRTVFMCSCHPSWGSDGPSNSKCWHIDCLMDNANIMSKLNGVLESGFQDDNCMYFGEKLTVTDSDGGSSTVHECPISGGQQTRTVEVSEDGLIAIQMDDLSERDLLMRSGSVTKKWAAWVVLDVREAMMVTVTWRAVSSGMQATRMDCVMCRSDQGRRCKHEIVCQNESKLNAPRSEDNDPMEGGHDDEEDEIAENDTDIGATGSASAQGENSVARTTERNGDLEQPDVDDHGDEMETAEVHVLGKCVNKPKGKRSYYPEGVRRSFIMCGSERKLAERLTDLLEKERAGSGSLMFGDPDGVDCGGVVKLSNGRFRRCDKKRAVSSNDSPRSVTLFTLNHGAVDIVLLDWTCPECDFVNLYNGRKHGIFPARYGTAYTVELLYWWVHEMCIHTNSFRAVYETTTRLRFTASYERKFETGRLRTLAATRKANRRNANSAIRRFIQSIDMDSAETSVQLYSCKHCEVPLNRSDCEQLGIREEDSREKWRLKGVVIDAKVIALLKDGRKDTDRHDVVEGMTGISTRVVPTRDLQNALKMFFRLIRSCIAARRSRGNGGVGWAGDRFIIRDEGMYFRLGAIGYYGTSKGQMEKAKVMEYMNIIRWYIQPSACLCTGEDRVRVPNHELCEASRGRLHGTTGRDICHDIMSALFSVCERSVLPESGAEHGPSAVNATTSQPSRRRRGRPRNEAQVQDFGYDECWVQLKGGIQAAMQEQLDSCLELITFCLVEPICLGFFPYQTESPTTGGGARTRTDGTASNDVEGEVTTQTAGEEDAEEGSHVAAQSAVEGDGEERSQVEAEDIVGTGDRGTDDVRDEVHDGDDGEHESDGVQHRTDTSAQRPGATHGERSTAQPFHSPSMDRTDAEVRGLVKSLAKESVELHRSVAASLLAVSTCTHGNRRLTDWVCSPCSSLLSTDLDKVLYQNAVVGKYIRDVVRCGSRSAQVTRLCSGLMSKLLYRRIRDFERYLEHMSRKMTPSALQYWKRFGSACPEDNNGAVHNGMHENFLYVFPGRHRCRNGIDFDKVDKQECNKVYFKGDSAVPSFLTVQCCCAHPKLLGFVLLTECESISAALSSVVTHFNVPPRRIWYDNACNTFDSAMIRIPWYMRWTMLVVDRFYYTGHVCCNIFNGNLHRTLDQDRSVAAEVINAVIDKAARHIAYLKGSNVIPFVKVLFAQMNLCAQVRDTIKKDDLEDEDLLLRFRELFVCTCPLCVADRNGEETVSEGQLTSADGVYVFTSDNRPALLSQPDDNDSTDSDEA